MWLYIALFNTFIIIITHFILCDTFKSALILSNILWVIWTYIGLIYVDKFIHFDISLMVCAILSFLNFIFSFLVWSKMNWFVSKKIKDYKKENEFEYLESIINIEWYNINKHKK
jgi:hypothetical protein